ncbi:MAG TPA: GTPase [Gemmataceae bacterium]|jgi:tRNA modification GTPase|nr:GTPase [Gemmataceae bacterium]
MDATRRIPEVSNTIVALSSAPGAAARAIVRLSGPAALALTVPLFRTSSTSFPARGTYSGAIELPGLTALLPAQVHIARAPQSYTGQDLIEFHLVGSSPLVDSLIRQLLELGARAALPGEFTMRAFLAAKLDLTQAEAVLGVLQAGSRHELHQALGQLAGGVVGPMQQLREDLLCFLADLEAGLDFAEEDIRFIETRDMDNRLIAAIGQVTDLLKRLEGRTIHTRPFRVVLVGPPNAGKSSLFNALLGKDAALVSRQAGTTRDYLSEIHRRDGLEFELVDTAGIMNANDLIETQAQTLRSRQGEAADLLLLCSCDGEHEDLMPDAPNQHQRLQIRTKCDLTTGTTASLATSAVTGVGIGALWKQLVTEARLADQRVTAGHAARSVHHLGKTLEHLHQASASVGRGELELVALELRGALAELGDLTGAVFTDDLLDRIFSRFCIGK